MEPAVKDQDNSYQVPEWETQTKAGTRTADLPKTSLGDRFNTLLPPHRSFFGLRRRNFLIVVAGTSIALLALVIGLAVGLTVNHNRIQDLPLPTDTSNFTGDLTYYGVGLGACGITYKDSDDVVSISHILFDAEQGAATDPNQNPLCGRKIRAERYYQEEGQRRSVDLTVGDRCVGCQPTDLDTSTAVFSMLAPIASGRVDVTWAWLGPEPTASS
ncbi:MAG: hypothetical protein M1820_002855 [Bogoriella megaspora]|nr:MAG: hypothetical protein M1820_002855 [Bogoriella megaspora]